MNRHLRKCPHCGKMSLYRRASCKPEWKCDYCEEGFDDDEIGDDEIWDKEGIDERL